MNTSPRLNRPSEHRSSACRVYAFHMDPSSWKMRTIRQHNPHVASGDYLITFPIYVGQTVRTIQERYRDHCGLTHGKPSIWGRRRFMPTFHSAFDREIIALMGLYETEHPGVCLDALSGIEAEQHEVGFGRWLRSRGHAVYIA